MTVNVDDTVGDDSRAQAPSSTPGFEVHLDVFEGPFDLLLALLQLFGLLGQPRGG